MNTIKDKKILVIGGAGFIGSYVVKELLKEGAGEVVIYDNFVRGKMTNILDSLSDKRCYIYPNGGDVRDIDIFERCNEGYGLCVPSGSDVASSLQGLSANCL